MTQHVAGLPFALDPLIAEAKHRTHRRRLLLAVAIVLVAAGTAGAVTLTRSLMAGWSAARTPLDVRIDASHSSFPAGWQVSAQYVHEVGDRTIGDRNVVSLAHGAGSSLFHLRGQGRYQFGFVIEPRDHSTGAGCAKVVHVDREARYVATLHLISPSQGCTVTVARVAARPAAG